MDTTPDAILAFAAERAQQAWDEKQEPYLLARLSPDLVKEGVNYKEVLGEQRLKDFVSSAPERLKIVLHPTQKARIGLIPPDKVFEYPILAAPTDTSAATPESPRERSGVARRRYIVASFLQLLSELDDGDAAQVQIPTHILTKLMRDR
jgi:hypothetical protein